MPKVYLNLKEDGNLIEDKEGTDYPDLAEAKRETEKALHEMLAEDIKHERPLVPRTIEIVSENGTVMATVSIEADVEMHQSTKA